MHGIGFVLNGFFSKRCLSLIRIWLAILLFAQDTGSLELRTLAETREIQENRDESVTLLQGFAAFHLDGFVLFPGDLCLLARATWKETDNSVLWQRRDKLWLPLGCEHPNPAPLHPVQSVLSGSGTSFPTFPDHRGGWHTPQWLIGDDFCTNHFTLCHQALQWFTQGLWFHVDGFHPFDDLASPLKAGCKATVSWTGEDPGLWSPFGLESWCSALC